MANQVADGLHHMNLNGSTSQAHSYAALPRSQDVPHLSPFPKLVNPPPNVPPSNEELETALENARAPVLNSNDPEMQLAWAADALVYTGACADDQERMVAAKPQTARPSTPQVEHQLKMDALNVVTFLADQHHPQAEFLKGMWLEWGRFGQREDKKEAFRCYSRAADRGYTRAEYRLGMLYESYNDPIKALRHYHRGAEAGDAASCYRLGMMTLRGQHGQPQDYGKAIDLLQRSAGAADENAAQGAYVYGMLLAKQLPQIDIPTAFLQPDERQARTWIEKAAFLKFAKAQVQMGAAYELGNLGSDFNPALSVHYNALASKQGEAEADMALSKWFLVGSEGLFPKNEELAYTYAERAAAGGLATAEFALGYFHEIGMYVAVDLNRATEWYQKASQHGNADARGRIEGLSRKQVLNKKDHEQMAVQRIKSTYGRPPPRAQQEQLPQRRPGEYGYTGHGATPSNAYSANDMGAPARGTTPYPLDDQPPAVPQGRPASAVPYPLEDGPPTASRPGPVGGFFSPQPPAHLPQRPATTINPVDPRPSSAFQINPDLRSNSAMAVPQVPNSNAGYGNAAYGAYGGGRPSPQQHPPNNAGPLSRPMTANSSGVYDPRSRPGAGARITSGPPAMQQLGPQAHMGPQPGMMQHPPAAQGRPPNIGYSAPPDERRNRTYGPGSHGGGRMAPNGGPELPSSNSMPNFNRPPRTASRPSVDANGGGGSTTAPRPSQPEGYAARPPSAMTTASSVSTPPSRKPEEKKAPKTFEEMGVPKTKQDSECVSLAFIDTFYPMLIRAR